jgi:LuxR family maltose regulon positive regulatory protein
LAWLLERLPMTLQLVMLTRADPPLPLARLRARRDLTELYADDLRFTRDEVAAFLNRTMGLALTAADLAALTLQNHPDRAGFITRLQAATAIS